MNGALGTIVSVLSNEVCVLRASNNNLLLVHPVKMDGAVFLPATYAYATTMRRAQGATLELVGLWFDRKRADRGYGYVGASRAKRRADVFLVGSIRRTDWRPVGGEGQAGEQEFLGPQSESETYSNSGRADSDEESEPDSNQEGSSEEPETDDSSAQDGDPSSTCAEETGSERGWAAGGGGCAPDAGGLFE